MIKMNITKAVFEALIADNPEVEICIGDQICRDVLAKHFEAVVDGEVAKTASTVERKISEQVQHRVTRMLDKEQSPRHYFIHSNFDQMVANACDAYMNERVERKSKEMLENRLFNSKDSIDQLIARRIDVAVRTKLHKAVDGMLDKYQASIDARVETAIAKLESLKKLVGNDES